jgi:hypothetical protein
MVSLAGTISIKNWTGNFGSDNGSPTNDRLLYQTDPGYSAAQLAQFQFFNDSGTAMGTGAEEIAVNGWTEVVPVPEPGTWVGAILSAGIVVFGLVRRLPRRR